MNKIIVYKKENCIHCKNAIETLSKFANDVVLYDIAIEDNFSELKNKLPNATTVPQIFINDEHIGGNDDLQAIVSNGRLEFILGIEPKDKTHIDTLSTIDIIKFIDEKHGSNAVFTTSFGAEDQVISHIILNHAKNINIVTLDTQMLFPETIETWKKTEQKYNTIIKGYKPQTEQVNEYIVKNGENAFYNSIELRRECCNIRKIIPLKQALNNKDIWITGIRSGQAETRSTIPSMQNDTLFGMIKINPLYNWDEKMVWDYINENNIPFNPLHSKGFPSIGCKPCTRAIKPGEDIRAGRWWWESPEKKECGLHK